MNDKTDFPFEALKKITNEVLKQLQTAEAELKRLAPIDQQAATLEENERNDINTKAEGYMDWADETYQQLDAWALLNPNPVELSELNYTRSILKRFNLVASNIAKLSRSEEEKNIDDMQFHMMQANRAAADQEKK